MAASGNEMAVAINPNANRTLSFSYDELNRIDLASSPQWR